MNSPRVRALAALPTVLGVVLVLVLIAAAGACGGGQERTPAPIANPDLAKAGVAAASAIPLASVDDDWDSGDAPVQPSSPPPDSPTPTAPQNDTAGDVLGKETAGDEPAQTQTAPPADSPTPTAPQNDTAGDVLGEQVYAENCAECHGNDGSGGVGPDIRGEGNPERLVERLSVGGDRMPAFQRQLTLEAMRAVAEYVTGGF